MLEAGYLATSCIQFTCPSPSNRSLYFVFLGTGPVKAFNEAIEEYHKRTCLRFEEKTDDDRDYIEIISGTG